MECIYAHATPACSEQESTSRMGESDVLERSASFVHRCRKQLDAGHISAAYATCEHAKLNNRVGYYDNLSFVREVEQRRGAVQDTLLEMDRHSEWVWMQTEGPLSLFREPSSGSLLIDGIVDAPLFEMLFLLNEPDLYASFLPDVLDGYLVNTRSKFSEFDMWCLLRAPMLFDHRDVCLHGDVNVIPCASGNGVLFMMNDMAPPRVPQNCRENTVRVNVENLSARLLPLRQGSVRVTVLSRLDTGATKWCPRMLCHWMASGLAVAAVQQWAESAKDLARALRHAGGYGAIWCDRDYDADEDEGPTTAKPHKRQQSSVQSARSHKLRAEDAAWQRHRQRLEQSAALYQPLRKLWTAVTQ